MVKIKAKTNNGSTFEMTYDAKNIKQAVRRFKRNFPDLKLKGASYYEEPTRRICRI